MSVDVIYQRSDGYWLGRMSCVLGIAAQYIDEGAEKEARKHLRSTLAEFIASPVPCEEVRESLRRYMK